MAIAALFTSSTGLQAASAFLDVVSNNVANLNTSGFKTQQTTFQDLLYTGQPPATAATPVGTQIGTGTSLDATTGLFTQGPLTPTGAQLDVAINGEGFLAVTLPDGSTGYTRAGNLSIDSTGALVTSEGFRLATPITLPANTTSVAIGTDGTVTATTPAGPQQVGQISLTRFTNPAGLARVGNTTFVATASSGTATTGTPGTNGLGTLSQGFLEGSNVEVVTELVNLLIAQRTFTFNTQAIQVENQVLQSTTSLIQ
jgi:flagellar basal-body rod protein FlgG